MAFDSISVAVQAFARGEFIIVLDSADRENEGDLIIAASDLSPEKAAFMIRYTSGYICAPLTASLAARLQLPQMVAENQDLRGTAYTISVDAGGPNVTGISAYDRSQTCRALADPTSTVATFRRPGHILPLQAREGGVRVRAGHTEAAIEFCRLAHKECVGVLAELVEDGKIMGTRSERSGTGMMRAKDCLAFGKLFGIKCVTIQDLIQHLEEMSDH